MSTTSCVRAAGVKCEIVFPIRYDIAATIAAITTNKRIGARHPKKPDTVPSDNTIQRTNATPIGGQAAMIMSNPNDSRITPLSLLFL